MAINHQQYGTWIPPKIDYNDIVAFADKDGIKIYVPSLAQGSDIDYYGTDYSKIIQVSRDIGVTWETITGDTFYFDREVDGFPEKDDLTEKYRIKACYKNQEANKAGEFSEVIIPDVSGYGTWKISKPLINSRVSDRTITLILSQQPKAVDVIPYGNIKYRVSVKKYEQTKTYLYKKTDGTETVYTDENCTQVYSTPIALPYQLITTNKYVFDNNGEKKAELFELQKIVYKLGNDYYINATHTTLYTLADNEDVMQRSGDSNSYIVIETDNNWYKPAESENPYTLEDNYKAATQPTDVNKRYVESDNTYVQTMPLSGQSINNMYDTKYGFRVMAFNEAYESEYVYISEIATCTSIRDIVKANADYKKLYVEELSAISANIGVIKQGALGENSDNSNHISLSDVILDDGSKWYKGETRLGGEKEYLKITVKKDANGQPVLDDNGNYQYTFEIKASSISMTSGSTTDLSQGTYLYDSSSPKNKPTRLHLTSQGFEVEQAYTEADPIPADFPKESDYKVIAKISMDSSNNLMITNDPENEKIKEEGIHIDGNLTVYHFNDTVKDEDKKDSKSLNLNTDNIVSNKGFLSDGMMGKVYNGVIDKDNVSGQVVVLSKSNNIEVGNKLIIAEKDEDGNLEWSSHETWNGKATTEWGLTTEQINSHIFKRVEVTGSQ